MRKPAALALCLASLLAGGGAYASGAGSSGAEFLRIGLGARPAALGENFTGLADDVNAVAWNPAGLGQLTGMQFSAMHLMYVEGISFEYLAASCPVGEWGSIALSGVYVNIPPFDSTAPGSGLAKGTASDGMAALSWGGSFKPLVPDSPEFHDVYYGMTAKVIYRSLGGYQPAGGSAESFSAVAAAFDVGAFWAAIPTLTTGVVVQNVGSTITFLQDESDALPMAVRAGAAWRALDLEPIGAVVLGDVSRPYDPDGGTLNEWWAGGGLEITVAKILALRGGYRLGPGGGAPVGGAGLGYGPVSIDYAFMPLEVFGQTHRMGLTVKLGTVEKRLPAVGDIHGKSYPKKRIVLGWSPVPGAVGYHIDMRSAGAAEFKRITKKPRTSTEVPVKGLRPGAEYVFRVTAVDQNQIEGRPRVFTYVPEAVSEGINSPSGLVAQVEGRAVTLSWEAVEGAVGYHVYYRRGGGAMRRATAAPRKSVKLVVKGLSPQTYEFSVSAVDSAGKESEQAAPVPAVIAP